jgi:PAS domain S-box-containing protein
MAIDYQQFFELFSETMSDVIWTMDLDMNLTWVSPTIERQMGYSARETLSRNLCELVSAETLANLRGVLRSALAGLREKPVEPRGFKTLEIEVRHKDGRAVCIEARMSFIRDAQGRPNGVMGINRDITARKRTDARNELLEKQLLHAKKMEALGTLAGGIAHDFNNLLYIVLGCSRLAIDGVPVDSEAHRNLRDVMDAGQRAARLVRQILTFAQRTEQTLMPRRLAPIVREAAEAMQTSLPPDIDIDLSLVETGLPVLAEPAQIRQVVLNLCNNACYAMRYGGGLLSVALDEIALGVTAGAPSLSGLSPGRYARLIISDTGCGMDPETLERALDPYFTTKGPGEGSGMGLSAVHGIVKIHGGAMTVESAPSRGTAFSVYLPTVEQQEHATPRGSSRPPPAPMRAGHVMFVDDEPLVARMAKRTLSRLGYEVSTFTSPVAALQAFREAPDAVDAVITDQSMPGMFGVDLARELLKLRPSLPIALISGLSDSEDRREAEAVGIRELLEKPVMGHGLERAVLRLMGDLTDEGPDGAD